MNKYKSKKGISFLTVIGSYGGFHKTITNHSLHLCVGWIAFTIFFYDVENALAKTLLKNSNEQLNIGVVVKSFYCKYKDNCNCVEQCSVCAFRQSNNIVR